MHIDILAYTDQNKDLFLPLEDAGLKFYQPAYNILLDAYSNAGYTHTPEMRAYLQAKATARATFVYVYSMSKTLLLIIPGVTVAAKLLQTGHQSIKDYFKPDKGLFRGRWYLRPSLLNPSDTIPSTVTPEVVVAEMLERKGVQPYSRPCYLYYESDRQFYRGFLTIAAAAEHLEVTHLQARRAIIAKTPRPLNGFYLSHELSI